MSRIDRLALQARPAWHDLADDERGDVPGWAVIAEHIRQRPSAGARKGPRASLLASPPKAHLPGKDASNPQFGEGGRPFEPGRVRGTHGTAGAVGVPTSRLREAIRELHGDEVGDVPGWVLITLMTAGLVVGIWLLAGPALEGLFTQAIARVTGGLG